MILTDVMKALDQFSPDQLRQLREYIQQRVQQIELKAGTLNMDDLLEGLEEMRAGLTDEEFGEIERAMNEEYIEPLGKDE
ncbi:MAG: hypothetical protein JNM70_16685 [Anaerolineae bacterium]|nr:hypothetical protein [Anaerolineae bacterium]